MLTWLDALVAWCVRGLREQGGDVARAASLLPRRQIAGMLLAELAKDGHAKVQAHGRLEGSGMTAEEEQAFLLLPAIRPFLDGSGEVLAVQVVPELQEDLALARAPRMDAIAELLAGRTVYLDYPRGRAPIQPGRGHVRAVFLRELREGICADAVVETADGEVILTWPFDGVGGIAEGDTILDEPIDAAMLDMIGRVDAFVRLSLIYYLTSDGYRTPLPRITEDRLRSLASDAKREAKSKTHSLFSVMRLASPPDRFGRPARGHAGWRLAERVAVRGHFKLQRHGEMGRLRKLIWVEPHERGPADGPRKATLAILD